MRLGEIVGHGGLPRLLARLIARERLPHAIMLEGIAGCGRRTLARALAQAVLCHAPQAGDACGKCASCRALSTGTHPDCSELPHDAEGADLPLDLVREVVVTAAFTSPLIGSTKVFILPGVERLAVAAANSLLKVLEEPPRGTYLVMTTSSAAGVLKTIRSRSQLYRMAPLSSADIIHILVAQGMAESDARALSLSTPGSMRHVHARIAPPPIETLARLLQGEQDESLVGDIVSQLPQKLADDAGDRTLAAEQRRVLGLWLDALLNHQRQALHGSHPEATCERIERVLRLRHDLERHLSPHLVVEGLALPTR